MVFLKWNLTYFAPDIDLSKNEWWKSHTVGEVKYLAKIFNVVYLVCQNTQNVWNELDFYDNIRILRVPWIWMKPLMRPILAQFVFFILALYLKVKWTHYVIERSFRLGWLFSIIHWICRSKVIYQLNEPIYYEWYIMPLQRLIIFFLNFLVDKYYVSHHSMSYLLRKSKVYIGHRGVDLERFQKISNNKIYDICYVWSATGWQNIGLIYQAAIRLNHLSFLIIVSWDSSRIQTDISEMNITNITVKENIGVEEVGLFMSKSKIGLALYDLNTPLLKRFGFFYSPIKVHEYKACWLPVIATNLWNLTILVKDSGILINNSVSELVDAIERILSNNDYYTKLSQRSKYESENIYNRERVSETYIRLFAE